MGGAPGRGARDPARRAAAAAGRGARRWLPALLLLTAASFAGCGDKASTGGTGTTGGGGDVPGKACGQCVYKECLAEGNACSKDAECKPFWSCADGCRDQSDPVACVNACHESHPDGGPALSAFVDCSCTSCPECTSLLDACEGGSGGAGGAGTGGAGGSGGSAAGGGGQGGSGGAGGDAPEPVVRLAAGFAHTCALLKSGAVRCWGDGTHGQLGYGNPKSIGDVMTPAAVGAGNVPLGGVAVELAVGDDHTCARLKTGAVRCWGRGDHGRLGYGNLNDIGDGETPASAGDVKVGGSVIALAAAWSHTCALLDGGKVRCWGASSNGKLGHGNAKNIGDDEIPSLAGDVNVGGVVVTLAAGDEHTCAELSGGKVRCWGLGLYGQLGYGTTTSIGDDEAPASAGPLLLEEKVVSLVAGYAHTCALLDGGKVRCWGAAGSGQLGYGNTIQLGDDEPPSSVGYVDVGGPVAQLVAGYVHTCALLVTGSVRCWGQGNVGQLGYGSVFSVGDAATPATAGDVEVGGKVVSLAAGYAHTCAVLETGAVRCWGFNGNGQLGYGHTSSIGDDELPSSAGDVPLF